MARKLLIFLFLSGLFVGLFSKSLALEKVKLGTPIKMVPDYYLPILSAEERGFWKENGLEVEWVPFDGGTAQMRAMAAGASSIGIATTSSTMTAVARGLPLIMVSEYASSPDFYLWVLADSSYRHPRDLRGKRIGVTALGASSHAYARIIFVAHGVEKDVRFVGAGGTLPTIAGLKTGAFEAVVQSMPAMVTLKVDRTVREFASTADYLPKPWFEQAVVARKDFTHSKPDVVRKILKATLQSVDFIQKNPRLAMDKMKSFHGLSEEAAKLMYEYTRFTTTGKLDRRAVENVRKIFIDYGIITEKAPAVDELFTNDYTL